jgi:hypothetical protein
MSTIVIACQVTGQIDKEDRAAMILAIDAENVRRAGLIPALPSLPKGTVPEIRSSYEAIYTPLLVASHASRVEQAVEAAANTPSFKTVRKAWSQATAAQQAAALAALTT